MSGAVTAHCKADTLVIGGGPAAVGCAVELARSGARTVLLTREVRDMACPPELIAPGALRLLDSFGFDSRETVALGLRSYGGTAIWGGAEPHHWSNLGQPGGGGVCVIRSKLDALLRSRGARRNVQIIENVHETRVDRCGSYWEVFFRAKGANTHVTSEWIVDATGRRAGFARAQGARRITANDLIALGRSTAVRARPQEFILEAVRNGWWYAMPSGPNDYSAVLVTSPAQLKRFGHSILRTWSDTFLSSRLLRERLPPHTQWSKISVQAAAPGCLEVPHGDRWVAVGDAAMQFDPLEGQGVARALGSALAAAKAICSRTPEAALRDYAEQLQLLFARHLRERQRLYEIAGSALR